MGIEDDLYEVRKEVTELRSMLDRFVELTRAAFGDSSANDVELLRARLEDSKKRHEYWQKASSENHQLLVEISNALGIRGKITREKLLEAAQKRRAKLE